MASGSNFLLAGSFLIGNTDCIETISLQELFAERYVTSLQIGQLVPVLPSISRACGRAAVGCDV